MAKRFSILRIFGFLILFSCTAVTLVLAAQETTKNQPAQQDVTGLILLDSTSLQNSKKQLPAVIFDHNLHTKKNGQASCASCHEPFAPSKGYPFFGTEGKTGKNLENAYHAGCISCHQALEKNNEKSGPLKAECRSCHNSNSIRLLFVPNGKTDSDKGAKGDALRKDGGMNAALHALHTKSPHIAVEGKTDNCSACHHPVEHPVSPNVLYDSCRSCHKKQEGGPAKPSFATVGHRKCISCHLTAEGKGVKAPLTCTECHAASEKTGLAKGAFPERLMAGQPDTVVMGLPPLIESAKQAPPPPYIGAVPDAMLEAAQKTVPSMPAVPFNHKLHEKSADNCIRCHHKNLQKCTTCHTLEGSPKGNFISSSAAMHMPGSNRSCVGCHEQQKTARPECAGCHSTMPPRSFDQTNCAACHSHRLASNASPSPERMLGNEDTLAQYTIQAPDKAEKGEAKPPIAPDTVVIGQLSEIYEPTVFKHTLHMELLGAKIMESMPGMNKFHSANNALCASCHHNSPRGTTPPRCASCHPAKRNVSSALSARGTLPDLKTAYHRQCMTCHTAMSVSLPANTDCIACHAKRNLAPQSSRKPGKE